VIAREPLKISRASIFCPLKQPRNYEKQSMITSLTKARVRWFRAPMVGRMVSGMYPRFKTLAYLFAAVESGERFNPDAVNFNEDISLWDMSSAMTIRSMFYGAASFNQPPAD
jgi:hypothetical protein